MQLLVFGAHAPPETRIVLPPQSAFARAGPSCGRVSASISLADALMRLFRFTTIRSDPALRPGHTSPPVRRMWSFLKIYELATVAPRPIPPQTTAASQGADTPFRSFDLHTPSHRAKGSADRFSEGALATDATSASWAMTSTAQPEPLQASQSNSQNQFTISTHDQLVNHAAPKA